MMKMKMSWPTMVGLAASVGQLARRGRHKRKRAKFMLPWARPAKTKNDPKFFLLGLSMGALLTFLSDARWGNRRRALARDQVTRLAHSTEEALGKAGRDLKNRAAGIVAEAQQWTPEEAVPDQVLEARVREALGRVVSHPRGIEVAAHDGRVILSGPVLKREVGGMLAEIHRVRGVREVENQLEVHRRAGNVPGLQGGSPRRPLKPELAQEHWTPGIRLVGAMAGTALAASTFTVGGIPRVAGGALGLGLLARSITNIPFKRLTGVGSGRRAVDIQKAINIDAPVEEVFNFYSNFENFPRFMANVREVRDLGEGRSHWVVEGPGGITAQWNATLTKYEPDRVIAWRSDEDTMVGNAGIVRFDPGSDGGTRVTVRMSYNPPAGALGHAIATLFNSNPKQAMDEDLVRLKSLLETGKTSAGGEQVRREELNVAGSAEHESDAPREPGPHTLG